MSLKKLSGYCHLGLTVLCLVGGTVTFFARSTLAQITPDATLPVNSIVLPNGNINRIEGGTQTGNNLFHSFESFSIPTGTEAFFNNSTNIQNIFSRVTGRSISNIDGLIRANGTANLFLLNPNGIIFGPNASLNIGGSFLATTARSFNFADGTSFGTINPNLPPLLTINVPIGLQFGSSIGSISVQGARLTVQPGQSLALVGGNIAISQGNLIAPGGRIEIGSIADNSTVNFNSIGNSFGLEYSGVGNFGDIQLTEQTSVDSSGIRGGDIQIKGRKLSLQGSRIASFTQGTEIGGIVTIDGTDSVELTGTGNGLQTANLFTTIFTGNLNLSSFRDGIFTGSVGAGGSGNLTINTRRLTLQNDAIIANLTTRGTGGNLTINGSEVVELVGTGKTTELLQLPEIPFSLPANLNGLATASLGNAGNAGNLTINTRQLIIRDAAFVLSATLSNGKGGDLRVNAVDFVEMSGRSGLFTTTLNRTGQAGNLQIYTPKLTILQRSVISSATFGAGNAGDLTIDTQQLLAEDGATINTSTFSLPVGFIIDNSSAGAGGNLTVNASELIELIDGGGLISQTYNAGNAGDLIINTRRLIARGNRSGASTATVGDGKGGNLTVNASEFIDVTGSSPGAFTPTEQIVTVILLDREERARLAGFNTGSRDGAGNAGNLTISTPKLTLQEGAGVITSTTGTGLGGNLTINASDSVTLIGKGGLVTATLGSGTAGNLLVNSPTLNVRDGAVISADTLDAGNAGNLRIETQKLTVASGSRIGAGTTNNSTGLGGTLTINANSIELTGTSADGTVASSVVASSLGTGNAGNLQIHTRKLSIRNGANATVSGEGEGAAGNLNVTADSVLLDGEGGLRANTAAGDRGNITLQSFIVQMRRNSNITTNASGSANGGNISINSDILAALENSDIRANAVRGRGGNIQISTQGIFRSADSDVDASSQLGINGIVNIQTPDVDPTQGLLSTPQIVNPPRITTGCQAVSREVSNFIITGTGGVPLNPAQPLTSEAIWIDARSTSTDNYRSENELQKTGIVEAQGWIRGKNGEIILIAQTPVTPANFILLPASCK